LLYLWICAKEAEKMKNVLYIKTICEAKHEETH